MLAADAGADAVSAIGIAADAGVETTLAADGRDGSDAGEEAGTAPPVVIEVGATG
jgi:hypothetical protein